MPILTAELISLQRSAKDKQDAIRQAGKLLVRAGRVMPEYVDGMLAREESMSTSLGNGVAIPHGIFENRNHILETGISVVQLVEGVIWDEEEGPDEDERVRLVIGIAASSDEHVGVLSNLAEAIENETILADLLRTTDPEVILKHLGAEPRQE